MDIPFAINMGEWFTGRNAYLTTVLMAMLPLSELRGAIPVAHLTFNLPLWQAFIFAVIGNMIPVPFILWFLGPASRWLSDHFGFMRRFFDWLFARTRRKLEERYEIYAELALAAFVAIPLPVTGAWTGAVAAFVFDIPFRKALLWIFVGVLVAGVVVTSVVALLGENSFLWKIFVGG